MGSPRILTKRNVVLTAAFVFAIAGVVFFSSDSSKTCSNRRLPSNVCEKSLEIRRSISRKPLTLRRRLPGDCYGHHDMGDSCDASCRRDYTDDSWVKVGADIVYLINQKVDGKIKPWGWATGVIEKVEVVTGEGWDIHVWNPVNTKEILPKYPREIARVKTPWFEPNAKLE